MDIEEKVREALLAEIQRQSGTALSVGEVEEGGIRLQGVLNLDDVALAITGALAGGP